MFDGMPEQFYHFLAKTSRTTPTPPTTLEQHHFPAFDASYHHHLLTNNNHDDEVNNNIHHHHHHHHQQHHIKSVESSSLIINPSSSSSSSLVMFHEIPWSNDEMLALFRIRSSLDNTWFPDFIWENVSRKLAELGFKRSAEKCKEKFEEETRSFNCSIITDNCSNKNNNNNNNNNNNYRLFSELEVLCNNNNNNNNNDINVNNNGILHHHHHTIDVDQEHLLQTTEEDKDEDERRGGEIFEDEDEENEREEEEENNGEDDEEQSMGDSEKTEEKNTKRDMRKRKRQKKFEMFKGFCEKIVNKMMAQQQQLHCKILQDMVKRDEEKIAKEEAWKRLEFERLEKQLEFRANEKAIAGDRQDKILDFLNKFNSSSSSSTTTYHALDNQSLKQTLEKLIITKVPNIITSSNNSSILTQDSIISALHVQPTSPSCTTTTTHDHDHDHGDDHDPAQAHTPLVMSQQTCRNIEPNSSWNENNLGVMSSPSSRLVNSKLATPMISSSSVDLASQNPNPDPLISYNDLPREFSKSGDHTSTNATDHITDEFKTLEDQGGLTRVVGNCKDDNGRRWPRDEVLALINIRCSLFNNNNNGSGGNIHNNDRENFSKGPLWERISQKMMELGYKRSAKRCKEKWENINKYFRKTKDLNKKRSIDSRTCPYFHQLSHLYSQGQGAPVGPTDRPAMNQPGSPENRSMPFIEAQLGGSSAFANENANDATIINTIMHANEGVVKVPGFDFEF